MDDVAGRCPRAQVGAECGDPGGGVLAIAQAWFSPTAPAR
jgi:hypothetical protein